MVNDRVQKKALCVWIQLLWERASLGWSSLHPLTLTEDSHNRSQEKDKIYHKLKQSPKKESHNMPQICVNKKYMPDKERHQSLMIKRAPRKTDSQNPSPRKQKPSKHKTYAQSFAIKVSNKTVQILRKKWKVTLRLSLREKTEYLSWTIAKKGEERILC